LKSCGGTAGELGMIIQHNERWNEKSVHQYKSYTLTNFRDLPEIKNLSEEKQFEIEVVGNVFPFKTNNYVVEQLIDWDNIQDDPMFILTFPQKDMLRPKHYDDMANAIIQKKETKHIQELANEIRLQLNPHPAGQMEFNIPRLLNGTKLYGMQHKYRETVLFFPSEGQTCHAYCSFCFRWPQFVGIQKLRFATKEVELLIQYLKENEGISDILFTGGDPLIMDANVFSTYIDRLLDANLSNLRTIRIGTKALSYWPYKFLTDSDSKKTLNVFQRVVEKGLHLAFMAHINHPIELSTDAAKRAISLIRSTGAEIRTQSPILAHVNDNPKVWVELWKLQVSLGCIPYYMFVVRDTGAQHYFGISLVRAYEIFRDANSEVSGLCKTVRGPVMATLPGKIHIIGEANVQNKKAILLQFIQGRNPQWVQRPFLAEYDRDAIWIDSLKPFDGHKFFFEDDLAKYLHK
jgi:L-lysine 2,3-aminomutase